MFSSFTMKSCLSLIRMCFKGCFFFFFPAPPSLTWTKHNVEVLSFFSLAAPKCARDSVLQNGRVRKQKMVRGYALERTPGELWKTSQPARSYSKWSSHRVKWVIWQALSFGSSLMSDTRMVPKCKKHSKMFMMMPCLFSCATQTVHTCLKKCEGDGNCSRCWTQFPLNLMKSAGFSKNDYVSKTAVAQFNAYSQTKRLIQSK